jgi:hypothetical protein
MSDEIKNNILSASQWLRILIMLTYAVICWVMGIIIICLVIGQALFSLITGKNNEHLRNAAAISIKYVSQILSFMTYCSEDKPFPFSPLPKSDISQDDPMQAFFKDEESSAGSDISDEQAPSAEQDPAAVDDVSDNTITEDNGPSAVLDSDPEDDVFADMSFTNSDEEPNEEIGDSDEEEKSGEK